MSDYRAVDPADPEHTRKKSLRTPRESMKIAADIYPKAVVHSEKHASQNAARSGVKRIQAGEGDWSLYPNRVAFVRKNPDGITWDVAVGFHFKSPDRERADAERARQEAGEAFRAPRPPTKRSRGQRSPS